MTIRIPATQGADYRIGVDQRGIYYLCRRSARGNDHIIPMSRDDVIRVSNQLIDLLEQDKQP